MKNNCKGQHLHFLSVVSLAIYITTFSWPSLSPKHMAVAGQTALVFVHHTSIRLLCSV